MLTNPHTGLCFIRNTGKGKIGFAQWGKKKNIDQLSTLGLNYIMLCEKNYVAVQFCSRRGSMIQKLQHFQCI